MSKKIDAAVYWKNGKGYFFEGDKYYQFTPGKGVDAGYPKRIEGNWKGFPPAFNKGIDAALYWKLNKKGYFFKGDKYIRYTPDKGVDTGYPKKIKGNWKGWPDNFTKGIDAAVYLKDGKGYFFKGDQYIRHTQEQGIDAGFPKKIRGNWKGLTGVFASDLDAALLWKNGKLFFFKDEQYMRFTLGKGVDDGYPKDIGGTNWNGLFKRYSDAAVREIIETALKGKFKRSFKLHLADGTYYFPSLADARKVMDGTSVDIYRWTREKFDCDDFAFVLKAEFAKDAYADKERRAPHCFGMVWGNLPRPHAINWMINDDQKLRFIEPQNDKIFSPRKDDKGIFMMIS